MRLCTTPFFSSITGRKLLVPHQEQTSSSTDPDDDQYDYDETIVVPLSSKTFSLPNSHLLFRNLQKFIQISSLEYRNEKVLGCDDKVDDDDEEEEVEEAISYYHPEDAILLQCDTYRIDDNDNDDDDKVDRKNCINETSHQNNNDQNIFGISFNSGNSPAQIILHTCLCPQNNNHHVLLKDESSAQKCICNHPRGSWIRRQMTMNPKNNNKCSDDNGHDDQLLHTSIQFLDLTPLQIDRRKQQQQYQYQNYSDGDPIHNGILEKEENDFMFRLDNPASVLHILRSSFNSATCASDTTQGHLVSPWRNSYYTLDSITTTATMQQSSAKQQQQQDQTVDDIPPTIAILLCGQMNQHEMMQNKQNNNYNHDEPNRMLDELEQKEIEEFIKFRTGDACPSYYLYSSTKLNHSFNIQNWLTRASSLSSSESTVDDCDYPTENTTTPSITNIVGYTLLVYKPIPPRSQFTSLSPPPNSNIIVYDPIIGTNTVHVTNQREIIQLHPGCLWERIYTPPEDDGLISIPAQIYNRMVPPPYQNHNDLYPGLLDMLLTFENLKVIINEAKLIPQWTPWPEKNHYQSVAHDDDNDNDNKNEENGNMDSIYPASWTVFPLCHTFPATDISAKKWIQATCNFVPQTTLMLKRYLGDTLRTALFSRLEPRTILGAHAGWADLANHVLRVHIPLLVPSSSSNKSQLNNGLCGLWVDGCVETHDFGRVLCFDDSKTHRAFNYSDDERVVLILDLERCSADCSSFPNNETMSRFPVGTATGGHTEELDSFIKQFDKL